MACFVDTNVLVRLADSTSSGHASAQAAIHTLLNNGELLCISAQIMIEFWAVATRPINVNGLGWTIDQTNEHLTQLLGQFELLSEADVFLLWRSLVTAAAVSGKHAHDARLGAVMQQNGLARLLTFNVQDFTAFQFLIVLHPAQVIAPT
jgi:predicted nucleic acid-binding protein